jgi:hypothetical protein
MFSNERLLEICAWIRRWSGGVVLLFPLLLLLRFQFGWVSDLPWHPLDDWSRYHENAQSILENGWMKNQGTAPYYGPGGFLYNYFIVLIYSVFGVNPSVVYVVQSLLLGGSVFFFLHAVRNRYPIQYFPLVFTCVLMFFTLDFFWHYTPKLLSENLFVFFFSFFLWIYTQSIKTLSNIVLVVLVAAMIMARPALVVVFPLFTWLIWERGITKFEKWALLALSVLLIQGLAIRNFLIAGDYVWLPTEGASDSMSMMQTLDFKIISRKILFQCGWCSTLNESFQVRWHWIFVLMLYFYFTVNQLIKGHFTHFLFHLLAWTLFLTNILFVKVDSYGFRSVLPFIFLIFWLTLMSGKKETKLE